MEGHLIKGSTTEIKKEKSRNLTSARTKQLRARLKKKKKQKSSLKIITDLGITWYVSFTKTQAMKRDLVCYPHKGLKESQDEKKPTEHATISIVTISSFNEESKTCLMNTVAPSKYLLAATWSFPGIISAIAAISVATLSQR